MARDLLNLRCFEEFCRDVNQLERKTRKQLIRNTVKRAQSILLTATRSEVKSFGKNTGYLRRSARARIRFEKTSIRIIVGLRKVKPELKKSRFSSALKPPPVVYGGVWLNFGTQAHSNVKKNRASRIRRTGPDRTGNNVIAGIHGSDWVQKVWESHREQVEAALTEDIEQALRDTFRNNYRS